MENGWKFKGRELQDTDIIEDAVGFIYLITQLSTGKRYIGRKLMTKAGTKTVNGKKKKIRLQSDWKDYWSSSPQIKEWIKEAGGTHDFKKEILVFCTSRGSLVYSEEKALYVMGVLENDDFINSNIRSKCYRSWVKAEDARALNEVLKTL
jgi:hypothetical protein